MSLADLFDTETVRDLAGDRVFARGWSYHCDNRVELTAAGDTVRATVRGSIPYRVELWSDDGEPEWSCDCPAAEDGSFCKHCVAVALELAGPGAPELAVAAPPADESTDVDLSAHVAGLSHERLVELVLGQVESDWRLRERVVAEALAASGDAPSLAGWKRRIDHVFAPYDDYVSYREAAGWAADVDTVIDALEELCEAGHADTVALLAEYAHRCADQAINDIDDSDGWLSSISERLGDLHFAACDVARPDPIGLASRLVDLELTSELDGFHRAASRYAAVLGADGLAEYRRLLEPAWAKHVADAGNDRTWSRDFAIRNAMIGWALGTGDPDTLIDVKQQDLRLPDDYLGVARELLGNGRGDEAVEWARRGLTEHSDRPFQLAGLSEFLAARLRERGDQDAAVELFWQAFVALPSLSTYRRLLDEGIGDHLAWRERCVAVLDERVAGQAAPSRWSGGRPSDALVEIHMYEGDLESAWRVACSHGCAPNQLLILARAREVDSPLDAIEVYESEAFRLIAQKNNRSYQDAVELMGRIERLAAVEGIPGRFDALVQRVRVEHKPKRNLMALLDARRWPGRR